MIVFYFLTGESLSVSYVNYEYKDLEILKKIVICNK